MAYAPVSKTGGFTAVWVQLPPPALISLMTTFRKKSFLIPLILFIFPFNLRLSLISKGAFNVDTLFILTQAEKTLQTLQLQYSYGFGFPGTVILASIFIFTLGLLSVHDSVFAFNFMSAFFSSLSIPVLYLIVKKLFDPLTALLGAVLLSFLPSFLGLSVYGNTHTPCLFFLLLGILLLLLYKDSGEKGHIILSAISVGLMGGSRLQDMFFMLIPLGYLLYSIHKKNTQSSLTKNLILFLPLSLGVAFALHIPIAIDNLSNYQGNLSSYWELGVTNLYKGFYPKALQHSLNIALFNFTALGIIGSALGLCLLFRKSFKTAVFLFLWFLVPYSFYGNLSSTTSRFLVISFLPMAIALAFLLGNALQNRRLLKYVYILIFASILLIPFNRIYPVLNFRHHYDPIGDFARWVKDNTPPGSIIITADDGPFLGYYGKRRFIYQLASVYSPIKAEQFANFKSAIDKLLLEGKNIYVTGTGIFANNPDDRFYKFLLENYDLFFVGGRMINNFHLGEIYEDLFFNELLRIKQKS